MAEGQTREIDWTSARIDGGALTVELSGGASKAWKSHFETVLALLDSSQGRWGEVRLGKGTIEVAGVEQGSESDLRHFLESIVLQANTDTAPERPRSSRREMRRAGHRRADDRHLQGLRGERGELELARRPGTEGGRSRESLLDMTRETQSISQPEPLRQPNGSSCLAAYRWLTALSFPRRFAIVQFPNAPLIIAFLASQAPRVLAAPAHPTRERSPIWRWRSGPTWSWWRGSTGSAVCSALPTW